MLLVIAAVVSLRSFPSDDGLRHVGLAFGEPRAWGEVYPHSVFAEHPAYDPWWGYDQALRGVAALAGALPVPRLAAAVLVVKLVAFLFFAAFLLLSVKRAGMAREVRSPAGLAAAAVLVALFLSLPAARILAIRPFAFGSLYLLFALPGGGALLGAAAAALLVALYPYLFWVYALPVAAAHLLRGDRRFGAGTLAVVVAGVALQPPGFWGLLGGLARAERVRATLAPGITEFTSVAAEPLLAGAVVALLACALPFLPGARRLGVPQLLMLFFAPASARYVRYLIDVELVLLFVILAAGMTAPLAARLEAIGAFWRARLGALAARMAPARARDAGDGSASDAAGRPGGLRGWIAVLGACVLALFGALEVRRAQGDVGLERALRAVPSGSRVLTDFNLQYRLLFVRPDLRLVPSCELGFAVDAVLSAYRAYLNDGDPCTLAGAVGAAWYVGPGLAGFDPERVACLGPRVAVTGDGGKGAGAAIVVRPVLAGPAPPAPTAETAGAPGGD
jgi:hypothetical protein